MKPNVTGTLPGFTPSERLLLSRERLRLALLETAASTAKAKGQPSAWSKSDCLDGWKDVPGAPAVMDVLRTLWKDHPLHFVVNAAADAFRGMVLPLAQRNPLGLVFGAFLFGGLFVWSRPWRWISAPAMLAGLLPQLLAKAIENLKPLNWADIFSSLAKQRSDDGGPPN